MIDRIRSLERVARRLEPAAAERERFREPVISYAEDFLEGLPEGKAYEVRGDATAVKELPIPEEGREMDRLLAVVREAVDGTGLNPAAPGHMGYIPGGGIYTSSLGDYLAAVTNRYAGVRFASPGAVAMEEVCLEWMAELVGYPRDAGGNLASGGSVANLIAVVTAREACGLRARDFPRAVVYLTSQTHHCVARALQIAGVGESVVRRVPMDEGYRMRPDELETLIREDRRSGLRPWMVVASAGTTDVGAIDPLAEIADVAERLDLWFHVDGAYGAFFALVDDIRPRLDGMSRSDSLVLDPHKALFLPYGTGAVLVKDRAAMAEAHAYDAAYMQDAKAGHAKPDPADLSPELTKHFRGLRTWLPLQLHGVAPFRACLEEKVLLTRYFHRRVRELGFETGPEPDLTVSTYRWVPEGAEPEEADAFNRELVRRVHEDGRSFVSSTRLDGRFTLRMAALTFRTHLDEIDRYLEQLERFVEETRSR